MPHGGGSGSSSPAAAETEDGARWSPSPYRVPRGPLAQAHKAQPAEGGCSAAPHPALWAQDPELGLLIAELKEKPESADN